MRTLGGTLLDDIPSEVEKIGYDVVCSDIH